MQKLRKGDTVEVIAGRDKGKRGKILEIFPEDGKVRVEGVFVQKRHLKPGSNARMPNGGILDRPGRISASNVRFYSDKLGKAVRVGFKVKDNGEKVRVARGLDNKEAELD